MQFVTLGRTGAQVSAAGLGCGGFSRLGMAYGATTEEAADIVRAALDLGVTFIDTAQAYGTEEAVGQAVKGRRDGVFISTKVSPIGRDGPLTPAQLSERLDVSLKRLGVETVDLFNLHGVTAPHYAMCVETLVPELQRQQRAGKIRFLGVTEHFGSDTAHAMLARAVPDAHFDVVMVGFNLLNPSARKSVFPLTQQHKIGTLIMFAVRRALHDPVTLRTTLDALVAEGALAAKDVAGPDPLGFVAQTPGVRSLVEAAYRFCRHEPGADVILTGTGKRAHLEDNLNAILAPPLPQSLQVRLKELFGDVSSVSGN